MISVLRNLGAVCVCLLMQQTLGIAVAQENRVGAVTGAETRAAAVSNLGAVDDAMSLGLTGERRPPYLLQPSDVLEISFTFTPEFNQTLTIQPDGLVLLKGVGSMNAEGQTVPQFSARLRKAYQSFLRDPEVAIVLRDFQRPYFVAAGEVKHPGKYELRSETTLAEAVAIAGGLTAQARDSQVHLFHRRAGQWSSPRVVSLKKLMAGRALAEDLHLHPGDLIYVPQNTISRIRKYVPPINLGMYANPAQF